MSLHKHLNPRIWTPNNELRKEVKNKLKNIVNVFLKGLKEENIPIEVKDIHIVGSNANYNYTKYSDLDLHIINKKEEEISGNESFLLDSLYNYYKSSFNTSYNISIHGVPIELYIEDSNNEVNSNGIYSLKNEVWLKEPIIDSNYKEYNNLEEDPLYIDLINKLELAKNGKYDPNKLIDKLYQIRKDDMQSKNEYGKKNQIFKDFRNKGYLDTLKQISKDNTSKELSLESLKEKLNIKPKTKFNFTSPINEDLINTYINESYRGERSLREFICDLLYNYCGYYPNACDFTLHHKDGIHGHNNVKNIILLPNYIDKTNWNTSIHNFYRHGKFTSFNLTDDFYKNKLVESNGIDIWQSLQKGSIVNIIGDNIENILKQF